MKALLIFLLMFCTMASTIACAKPTAPVAPANDEAIVQYNKEKIDEDSIINSVKELSSEKYQGRLIGTEGNEQAADYIANAFKEIGLTSPEGADNYKQYYSFDATTFKSEPKLSLVGKDGTVTKNFTNGIDFTTSFLSSSSDSFNVRSQAYILENPEDLTAEKVKDKVVLISDEVAIKANIIVALRSGYEAGASFIIIEKDVESTNSMYNGLPVASVSPPERVKMMNGGNSIPIIYVNNSTFNALTDGSKNNESIQFQYNANIERQKKVCNVVGVIEGTDEKLKEECLVIGAHFDHAGSNYNGKYNPGALDNASGTAAMLGVARAIKAANIKPKKTIVFVAFNGEECGGSGSKYYVTNPVCPTDKTVMINLEMLGSSAVTKLSIDGSSDLGQQMLGFAQKLNIDAGIETVGGSDHLNFIDAGTTAVMLSKDDLKNGYHTYKDTYDKVDKNSIKKIVNLVMYYIEKTDDKMMETMYKPGNKFK